MDNPSKLKFIRKLSFFCFSVFTVLLLEGCFAVVAGGAAAGTVAYFKGDSEAVVESTVKTAFSRSLDAIAEMGLVVISSQSDETTAQIIARNAKDDKVTVTMESITADATKLFVRYGNFGDEEKSNHILQNIVKKF